MTARCSTLEAGRYARQLVLDGFGPAGQDRVGRAVVRVIGVGPAAAVSARYLVGAGVGACYTDALPAEALRALNPLPEVGSLSAAPPGALTVDPSDPSPATTAGEPASPELAGALAAERALLLLIRDPGEPE